MDYPSLRNKFGRRLRRKPYTTITATADGKVETGEFDPFTYIEGIEAEVEHLRAAIDSAVLAYDGAETEYDAGGSVARFVVAVRHNVRNTLARVLRDEGVK